MKADHRKQLEQNELAGRLSRWWKGSEHGSATTLYVILGAAILLVLGYFLWQYYAQSATKNHAAQWLELDQAIADSSLEELGDSAKGTPAGRAARAQLARGKLQNGLDKLGSESSHKDAIELISKVRRTVRTTRQRGW